MTKVYRARIAQARGPERPLVIKMLPPHLAGDPAAEARFIEEAKIALSLTHGNIVATFEAERDEGGHPFLVMEYLHGRSLRQVLQRAESLSVDLAVFIAREVARALRYTHSFVSVDGRTMSIAHLDVSPENILLSYAGQVKLTDFGIAQVVGALARPGGPFGKAPYVAPETLSSEGAGPSADLYALGAVLYEMICGQPPHGNVGDEETIKRLQECQVCERASAHRPDLDPELDELVAHALAPESGDRFGDAALMMRALSGYLSANASHVSEVDLAALMTHLYPPGAEPGASDGARLMAQAEQAGIDLSSEPHVDTQRLLALGTVPLQIRTEAGVTGPVHPPPEPEGNTRARRVVVGLLVIALLGLVVLGSGLFPLLAPEKTTEPLPKESVKAALETKSPVPEDSVSPPIPMPLKKGGEGTKLAKVPLKKTGKTTRPTLAKKDPDKKTTAPGPAGPKGKIRLNAIPYATVFLEDGTRLGNTPLRDVPLATGSHRLRLVNSELKLERVIEVAIKEGEITTLGVRLADSK
jgi:hypothetical protein